MRLLFLLTYFITLSLNAYADKAHKDALNATALTVHLDKATQNRMAIQTQVLTNSQLNPESQRVATLIDLQPLLLAKKNYITALSHEKIAQIHYAFTQQQVQHALKLQHNQTLSTRKLRERQSQLDLATEQLNTTQQQANNLRLLIQAQWGKVISQWILEPKNKIFKELSTQKRQLYRVYMPLSKQSAAKTVFLDPFAQREKAIPAHLVSYAPLNNRSLSSQSAFYYLTDTHFTTSAQRPTVWIPKQATTILGIKIPSTALVWHLGQAFVYVQQDEENFRRIPIHHKQLIDTRHYFIQNDLQQNNILVTQGAQLLLSEEFRAQIPAEDDDD